MSKLETLIAELCPDGVEIRCLEDCCNLLDKKRKPVTKASREAGKYPYYGANGVQDYVSDYIFDGTFVLVGEDGSVITKSGTPVVTWAEGKIWVNNHAHIIEEKDGVMLRYLYHYIQTIDVTSLIHGNIPKLTGGDFKALKIAVPPLEVQREIVRVLDSFTLLTAELTAELTARKKQYSFYRDKMLNFGNKAPIYRLSELCESIADGDHMPPPKSDDGIPFITISNVTEYHDIDFENTMYVPESYYNSLAEKRRPRKGDILYTVVGSYGIPVCIENDKKFVFQRHIAILRPNNAIVKSKYLFHAMQSTDFKIQADKLAKGAAQKTIALSSLAKMYMPVPDMNVQERIVNVLDNFEAICTDLNIGLPAEIEARQKQYEYYRDLLFTFAETGSTLVTDRQTELSAIKLIQYVFGYVTLPMGSLFDFRNGLSKGKDSFGTGIPFIRYTDVYNNRFLREDDITALVECTPAEIEKLKVHRGDVFFTRTSETAEDVGWSSVMLDDMGDCVFNGFTIKATPKTNYLLPEYCAFCFATDDFRQYVTSHCAFTTRASLTGKTIAEYQLAFPSIEKQQEIVDMLSKFHTLCNDLSAGLPAEIEARQKQYEYYRDKLLSFKEIQK